MIDQIIRRLFGHTPKGNLMKEAKAIAGAIPLIAQALVERRGHKVKLVRSCMSGAATDGQTIKIEDTPVPTSARDVEAFVRFTAVQLGLVHHEIGHVNYTDFTAKRSTDSLTRFLENLIEDIRQEMVHIACVRNGRDALDVMGLVLDHIPDPDPALRPEIPVEQLFTSWVLRTLRSKVRGEGHLVIGAANVRIALEQRIGAQAVTDCERLLGKVPYLTSTAQAIAMAAEMVDLLRQHQQQMAPKPQQQPAGDDGDDASASAPSQPETDPPQQDSSAGNSAPADDNQQGGQDASADSTPSADDTQQSGQDPSADNPPSADDNPPQSTTQPRSGQDPSTDNTPSADDTQNQSGSPQQSNATPSDPSMQQDSSTTSSSSNPSNGKGAGGDGSTLSDQELQDMAQALSEVLDAQQLEGTGDRAEQAQEMLQQVSQDLVENGAELVAFDPDVLKAALNPTTDNSRLLDASVDVEAGLSEVQRVRSVLKKRLQAQSLAKTSRSINGSKLVDKALVGVAMGDARLFAKHQQATLLDTAVVLAIDCSGSMSGDRIRLAGQAVYATACALEGLPGCHLAVIAFPDNQVVLQFGQRARKHRSEFGLRARGGTPMHEAIQMATVLLSKRREPRKVLLIATDGEPDSEAQAELAILAAKRMGIETMAIGIKQDVPKSLFETSATVHDMGDLSTAMLEMLGGRMLSVRDAA